MAKKVIIIGAGLTGLSAGIHLQKQGINTEIFELAGWAGGMCTAWERQGYLFDGCIHWMVGTKPGDGFYTLYREVDALTEDTVIYNAPSIQMEIGGRMLEIPLSIEKFKAFLLALAPEDQEKITGLCRDIEIMMHTKMPSGSPSGLLEIMRIMKDSRGFIALARKYLSLTMEDYAASFQSPLLRSVLYNLMPKEYSAEALIMMLGTRMSGNAGYPLGGARDVINRMETKYRALGGKLNFHSKVDEILVTHGKATAIRVKDALHPADAVIAACDAYDILKTMLKGHYPHPQLDSMLESSPLFPPLALVSFGLRQQWAIPFSVQYECPEGIPVAPGVMAHSFSLRSFDFDPGAAPENGSSVMVILEAPLEYWQTLRSLDLSQYRKEKAQLAGAVADAVERRIPGFKDSIAVVDVSTPATYVRLANLYKASFEGFAPTPAALKTRINHTVPGIKNLILCGQWTTAGGGICTAVSSGKKAAQLAAKK